MRFKETTWTVRNLVKSFAPNEYKQRALQHTKEQAGMEIYKLLEQMPNPAVVQIDEKITECYSGSDDLIEVSITIVPVHHKDVTIARGFIGFDPLVWIEKPTFFRRIKYAITGE